MVKGTDPVVSMAEKDLLAQILKCATEIGDTKCLTVRLSDPTLASWRKRTGELRVFIEGWEDPNSRGDRLNLGLRVRTLEEKGLVQIERETVAATGKPRDIQVVRLTEEGFGECYAYQRTLASAENQGGFFRVTGHPFP